MDHRHWVALLKNKFDINYLIKKYIYIIEKEEEMTECVKGNFDIVINYETRIEKRQLNYWRQDVRPFLIENFRGRGKLNVFLYADRTRLRGIFRGIWKNERRRYSYRCYFQRRLYFIQKYLDVLTAYPYACIRLRYL